MKNWLYLFSVLLLLNGCSDRKDEQQQTQTSPAQAAKTTDYENRTFTFETAGLQEGCTEESKMICALNLAVKCTLNPKFSECDKNKMPRFIFMEDDSLDRPSELSYKIKKIRPLPDGTVEVITDSNCNGNWFGLCKGTVIYVMNTGGDNWKVKDLYALQEL